MKEILFEIGPFKIYGYGTMIAIGIICAIAFAEKRERKIIQEGNSEVINIGICGLLGGFLGAKLLFWIVELPTIIKNPHYILSSLSNGFVVYGGLIGGIIGGVLYCKRKKISFWKYFDLIMPSVALAQGFGRIGCLFAGCCYGRKTNSLVGIVFNSSNYAPSGVRLIPTQIIMSIGDFVICIILILFAKKNGINKDGEVGGLYLMLYSVGRFFVEFLRADDRGKVGILSTSQFIAIFIFLIGIFVYNFPRRNKNG